MSDEDGELVDDEVSDTDKSIPLTTTESGVPSNAWAKSPPRMHWLLYQRLTSLKHSSEFGVLL